MSDYESLDVWRKSMNLAEEIYKLTAKFPKTEIYALSDQMKRAAVSIPSNISEGQARKTDKDIAKFLYIARGSKAELETQLHLAVRLGFVTVNDAENAFLLLKDVGMMINGFLRRVKSFNDEE